MSINCNNFINIGNQKIEIKNILMLKAQINYTFIYLLDGNYILTPITIGILEKSLIPHHFFRTHRSTLINLQYLAKINYKLKTGKSSTINLYNGTKVPLSRRRTSDFSKIVNFPYSNNTINKEKKINEIFLQTNVK